ncbi:MAG: hypothetical protein ACM3QU_10355 [Verrucomicrobiota bacterium]
MPGAFAPRFAIEAAFLILLGVGAGYADLRPAVIVALLGGGWILVALIELAIWRSQTRAVSGTVSAVSEQAENEPGPEEEAEAPAEPPALPAAEDEYPLRPNAADAPSEEVEEYTRILSGSPTEEPSTAVRRED